MPNEPDVADRSATDAKGARPASTTFDVLRRLGPVGPMAILALTMPPIGSIVIFTTASSLAPWLQSHGVLAVLLFAVAVAIFGGLALLPTYAQAYLAGFAFKFTVGLPAVMAGVLGAASIAYLLGRRASGERALGLINENPKAKVIHDALLRSNRRKALLIVTLVRLPPNSPFALTNLVLSSVRVPLPIYLLGTLIGLLPRTSLVVLLGSKASSLSFEQPRTVWTLVIGVVVTVFVLGVIGKMAQNALARMTRTDAAQDADVIRTGTPAEAR
jgi:uncharacterized membrane protein YdjX (TVP38/TMEM64 family)